MPSKFHNNMDAMIWLDTSAEQHALITQCFESARARITMAIEGIAAGKPVAIEWNAAKPGEPPKIDRRVIEPGPNGLCVFSDLDETMLDNSAYNAWLAITGRNFNETGSWQTYCDRGISLATPGARDFCNWLTGQRDAQGRPIELIFVTSRRNEARAGTVTSLSSDKVGLPSDRCEDGKFTLPSTPAQFDRATMPRLFMKGLKVPGQAGDTKYDHYKYVQQTLGMTPILWLGDNGSDFEKRYGSGVAYGDRLANAQRDVGRWGRDWIIFPNPVYGSFLSSLPKREFADGTIRTLGDDDASGPMTDAQVREPVLNATTPKKSVLTLWDFA